MPPHPRFKLGTGICNSMQPFSQKEVKALFTNTLYGVNCIFLTLQVHKANPIRKYQSVEIKSSDQPLTVPVSPKFSTRFHCWAQLGPADATWQLELLWASTQEPLSLMLGVGSSPLQTLTAWAKQNLHDWQLWVLVKNCFLTFLRLLMRLSAYVSW